jgi:hypothetical protein
MVLAAGLGLARLIDCEARRISNVAAREQTAGATRHAPPCRKSRHAMC